MMTTSDTLTSEIKILSETARVVGRASCSAARSKALSEVALPSLTTVIFASTVLLPTSIVSSEVSDRLSAEATPLALMLRGASVALALGSIVRRTVKDVLSRRRRRAEAVAAVTLHAGGATASHR